MKIPALKGHIDPTEIAPERLAGNPALTKDQKISEASRQFEMILLKQVLEASQKTVIHSSYSDDSMASGIYHDMITNQLADSISKSGKFGIAKLFDQQLESHKHPKTENAAPQILKSTHESSGAGVSPVRTEAHGQDARATKSRAPAGSEGSIREFFRKTSP